ncbi:MAG: WYL domain-containing protein [Candidatus Delongbacteria bacterium]|nr:WYL domain-containing protein [Candidatus Delongbacteria bacterium]MBN2835302.1 WYL domain-containing protein [Candidatus Delongbacteria bacterium]
MEKGPIRRLLCFVSLLNEKGYISKEDVKNFDDDFSNIPDSTFKRSISDLNSILDIKLKYSKRDDQYRPVNNLSSNEFVESIVDSQFIGYSSKELLLIYCFLNGIIDSKVYFPPLGTGDEKDGYSRILYMLRKKLKHEYLQIANFIEYRSSEHYKPNNLLFSSNINEIINSFNKNKLIKFKYKSSNTDSFNDKTIQPQKLLNYQGKWYLIGFDENIDKSVMFNLSYIKGNIKILHDRDFNYNISDYSLSSFGIIMSDIKEKAIIKFYPPVSERILEVIWDDEQTIRTADDNTSTMRLSYPVGGEDEIIGRVLRYGVYAEIVSPDNLRKKWLETIRTMNTKFNQEV